MSDDQQQAWDARYTEEGALSGAEANRLLVELAADLTPGRALDLGSGQGRNAFWLAAQGHTVTGLDLSSVAVDQANAIADEQGLDATFEAVDLTAWDPAEERWDLVVLAYLQVPEAPRQQIHAVAVRALAPGGSLILVAHHLDNITDGVGGPPYPEMLFTEDGLAADFSELEIERNEKALRPTENGEAIDIVLVAKRV